MNNRAVCLFCGHPDVYVNQEFDPMAKFYTCPVCGRYEITEIEEMRPSLDKKRVGAFLYYKGFKRGKRAEYRFHTTLSKEKCDEYTEEFRKGNLEHGHPVHIDNDVINAWYPKSFSEKVNMILLKLNDLAEYPGQTICLSDYELYGLMFVERYKADGTTEFGDGDLYKQVLFLTDFLEDAKYIKRSPNVSENLIGEIYITPEGYERIDHLQQNVGNGRNVLVAMKFGDETNRLRDAIKQGIGDAGYTPILIDEVEHNEFITPELLKHIKESRFVVVDLTHQNNGAYFEEGYAMGLGKPVIQLCQKDTKLHFDIAQKNTIMWEKEEDIPLRLANRIKATID